MVDNSDFEIESIADLREIVRAGETLDDRPVPEMVGVVSQLDPDQLTEALNAQRELALLIHLKKRDCERAPRFLPSRRGAVVASEVGRGGYDFILIG